MLSVAALLFGVVALAQGDWGWTAFDAIVMWQLLAKAFSGVFIGDREAALVTIRGIHRVRLDQVEAIEVAQPARDVRTWVWADGQRHGVTDVWNWRSPDAARHVALQLTRQLQQRGATAGMYDAITDEWPIAPADVHQDGAE